MIIELYGLPGTGKSTLARELERRGFIRVRIAGRMELVLRSLRFAVTHPVKSWWLMYYLVRADGNARRRYTLFVNGCLQVMAKHDKARGSDRAIIDQGGYQNLVSFFSGELAGEAVRRFAARMPQPDVLLILSAPREIRVQRLMERGGESRYHVTNIETWQEATEANDLFLKREAAGLSVPARMWDTLQPANQLADKVERYLETI